MTDHCAPALPVAFALLLGCTVSGVALRPDGTPGSEPCPPKALEAMRIARLRVGDAADVTIDVNQKGYHPISVNDGPVESVLEERMGWLGAGTRLYGRIWTSGPRVVIRYYEAHLMDGDPIPICAVAREGGGGLLKRPGLAPGSAFLDYNVASVYIVNAFR